MTARSLLSCGTAVAMLVGVSRPGSAQQALPPIHPIGAIEHVSRMTFRAVSGVRELPGERVLVNDIVDHQLLLLDSTLTSATAIADSTAGTGNAYGNMPGGLIAYRGDSTLFIDPASLSMLVLDGSGKVARVMAVPRPNEAIFLIGGPFGSPGFDPTGRLVFRGTERVMRAPPKNADAKTFVPQFPDSAPIVRVNLDTRAEDTVTFYKLPPTKMVVTHTDNGFMATSLLDPMPIVDGWALLPDGTVAVVRGHDFHIDWYHPDGTRAASPAIPFDWQRLTDSLKAFVLDSAKQAFEKRRAERIAMLDSTRKLTGSRAQQGSASPGAEIPGDAPMMVMAVRIRGDERGAPPPRGAMSMPRTPPPLQFVQPNELPDYRPAFGTGATRCDTRGNLWIRTSEAKDGRPVYDVVDAKGALVDRVQLPPFRTIIGFGPGVVYMGVADGSGAVHLERARIGGAG